MFKIMFWKKGILFETNFSAINVRRTDALSSGSQK